METFIEQLTSIQAPKTLFLLCSVFILADVLSGYLKAFKFKKMNSTISRDGYIKKMGWVMVILLGFVVDILVGTNVLLYMSAMVLIITEGISICENLGEVGVDVPFKKYFDKLKDLTNKEE